MGWSTALKSVSIRALVEQGQLQLGLFDQRNLVELESPDYPGERLVACRNDALAKPRAHKREELVKATEASLLEIKASVDAAKLSGQDKIGVRVGKIINKYKVAKHFELTIHDASLAWARRQDHIDAEAALDGLYIIRTSVSAAQMDAPTCVRNYKSLANVERAFRSLKTIDLKVRPTPFAIGSQTGCACTSSCACWPTTSSGTCARLGRRCGLPTLNKPQRPHETRWRPPNAQSQRKTRRLLARCLMANPCTASPPCWPNSQPSSATPAALHMRRQTHPPSTC